ncbi:unnamed protein product [Durusdinium trenchii]|uniref:Uncharacterized protein n=1 Tax=Durusdinium trenchii TaxID=1381693 RepID=A0ABP0NL21_9DINO
MRSACGKPWNWPKSNPQVLGPGGVRWMSSRRPSRSKPSERRTCSSAWKRSLLNKKSWRSVGWWRNPPPQWACQDSAMLDVAGAPARAESAVTLSTAQDAGANDEAECVKEEKSEEECPAGAAAALEAEQEAQRMRLFRCPFAEAVDLTYVKRDRQFPYSSDPDDQILRLGRRQLRSFIGEVYTAKRLEDRRREKAAQPRRALHFIMQEMLRRQHGVKCLVHQRSWQILEAVAEHASEDVTVGLFADFLDGTRDLDELSFYLYCSGLVSAVPEEPQANIPPSRLPMGLISESRCLRLVELLFSDLPKAKAVVKEEIEKQLGSRLVENSYEELSYMAEADGIEADALCYALLEGWRLCCLLLSKSMPHFNWRDTVLAFIQADVHGRGWLDPNEVTKVDAQQAVLSRSRELLPVMEQTSLGAFVFRILQHLGGLTEASLKEDVVAEMSHDLGLGKKEHEVGPSCSLSGGLRLTRAISRRLLEMAPSQRRASRPFSVQKREGPDFCHQACCELGQILATDPQSPVFAGPVAQPSI